MQESVSVRGKADHHLIQRVGQICKALSCPATPTQNSCTTPIAAARPQRPTRSNGRSVPNAWNKAIRERKLRGGLQQHGGVLAPLPPKLLLLRRRAASRPAAPPSRCPSSSASAGPGRSRRTHGGCGVMVLFFFFSFFLFFFVFFFSTIFFLFSLAFLSPDLPLVMAHRGAEPTLCSAIQLCTQIALDQGSVLPRNV